MTPPLEQELYNCKTEGALYRIVKFNGWFEIFSVNYVAKKNDRGDLWCSCQQGMKASCRHRTMVNQFRLNNHINDGWFYDYSNGAWEPPLNSVLRKIKERGKPCLQSDLQKSLRLLSEGK